MMYCGNCGKEVGKSDVFCSACGKKINVDVSEELNRLGDGEKKSGDIEGKKCAKHKRGRYVKIIFFLLFVVLIAVGIIKGCTILQEKKQAQEQEQKRIERERKIKSTLSNLGNRSSGSNDYNTAQYSMALLNLSTAALGKSNISNHDGMDAEEIKKDCFKSLEAYFKTDYVKTYAAMVFCADYFERDDVEYFYNGTKINSNEVKECVEELMFKNHISLSSLLVNERDRQICYTMSLRIRLAESGYISTEDIISELKQFVYEDKPVQTIEEDLLAEGITYEQIASDIEDSFTGGKLYYENLSPVGKMVFLYLMPRYVVQFDQMAGSNLWYNYFEANYSRCWEEIIGRDIFSKVIE